MKNAARKIVEDVRSGNPGGTYSVLMAEGVPNYGFIVGGTVEPLVFESVDAAHPGMIAEFLEASPHGYAGFWVDAEDGRLYVDGCDWVWYRENAVRLGAHRGEIAIWDLREAAEIRL